MSAHRARKGRHLRPSRVGKTTVAALTAGSALIGLEVATASSSAAESRSFATMLAQLRGCESGGNYAINTGNGYYGAYQFNAQTWRGVGGTGLPHQNPPAVQDEMATRLYESRGWQPWPACSKKLGLTRVPATRPSDPPPPPVGTEAPQGNFDWFHVDATGVTVSGWAFDPDNQPAPITVDAYVDGVQRGSIRADQSNPGVKAGTGAGENHGFRGFIPLPGGTHTVCTSAIGWGGGGSTGLGCFVVNVPQAPIGHLDTAELAVGGVRVSGWTLDRDTPETPTLVHVYVDGQHVGQATADQPRGDVKSAVGGSELRGFDTVVPYGSEICVWALDTTGQAGNTTVACREVLPA